MSTKKVKSSVLQSSKTTTSSESKITRTTVRSYTSIEITRNSAASKKSSLRTSEISLPKLSIALDGPTHASHSNPFSTEFGRTTQVQPGGSKSKITSPKNVAKSVLLPKYESPYRTVSPLLKTSSTKNDSSTVNYVSPYRGILALPLKQNNNTKKSVYDANYGKKNSPAIRRLQPPPSASTVIGIPNRTVPVVTRKPNTSPAKYEDLSKQMKSLKLDQPTRKTLQPGNLYIFNHEKFDNPKNETRVGSQSDVQLLEKTFKKFYLSINIFKNLTVREIKHQMEKIEKKDFTKKSCIVIAIMSHGSRLETIAAKDGSYSIDDDVLFPMLRNRTLEAKPKILIIQACKGEMDLRHYKTDSVQAVGRPSEILKCYSTFEGYVSYRSSQGSVFITTLCELIQEYGARKCIKEIMEMCTSKVKILTRDMQIPTISTTLTKSYIFGDYI